MSHTQKGISIAEKPPETELDPDEIARQSLVKIKKKFIVMSGKGGVGKTSVSVNLSIALANKGYKVGIMDVDVHGPDIPRMLGLKGMIAINEAQKLQPIHFSENLTVVSVESLMSDNDSAIIWRGPMKHSVIRQFMADAEWGALDFLIIDSPPGTGDEPLTVAQLVKDAHAIIVTTPQEVALADVRKSISFCKTLKMDVFGLIENMSDFICPHCGGTLELFGSGGGEKTATKAGIPFLGRIPFDRNMIFCGDIGTPYLDQDIESEVTKAFTNIVEKMSKLILN